MNVLDSILYPANQSWKFIRPYITRYTIILFLSIILYFIWLRKSYLSKQKISPETFENGLIDEANADETIGETDKKADKINKKPNKNQNIKKKVLTITDVVFIIAPRINAAGRIKHGNEAVALLTEFNLEQAEVFAAEIEQHNSDRKGLDKQITIEALAQIESNDEKENVTTVVYQENWHKGVIGIVASRLIETYYRPTIVFTKSGDKLAASARSVKDFDIYNALEACAEHLEQFGGHMYAAGMTLKEENYPTFKAAFERTVRATLAPELLIPEIEVDAELNLADINPKLIRLLNQFEPFGPQNRTPVFVSKNVKDTGYAKTLGQHDEHLKLYIRQTNFKTNII
jgi:single-stranded-DNA-specific exonuclease